MQFRRLPPLVAALLIAAASATVWPPVALAQPAAEPPGEADDLADGESPSLPDDREARLDALHERLASGEDDRHERWEREIRKLWSRSGSDTADLLLRRGREAMQAEELGKAVQHFGALVEHRPDFAEGWHSRATAFYAMDELGLALGDLERALALEPRHFGALQGLGVILERIGREEDALDAYHAAHALNPHMERVEEAIERLAPKVEGRDA
ncbi:MAG: hypothetical protein R6V44_11500 [Paracoccaceae bacterium]